VAAARFGPDLTVRRGRVIAELGWTRSEIVVSTKLFWGKGPDPNAMGLSRKQCVPRFCARAV
jgi:aryl-alcohol dehydrogenase-like predicted oxidoreductase